MSFRSEQIPDLAEEREATLRLASAKPRLRGLAGNHALTRKQDATRETQPVKTGTNLDISQSSKQPIKQQDQPVTLPEVTVTAKGPRSAKEIFAMVNILGERLLTSTSDKEAESTIRQIQSLMIGLENAPVWPTPKRDFVAGPFKFREFGKVWYDFGFESMNDKHWVAGMKAIYSVALGPVGIVVDLCDAFFATEEEDQEDAKKSIIRDEVLEMIEKKSPAVGKQMMKWKASKVLAKRTAIFIKVIAKRIPVAISAYELYLANTEGPSAHEAALETTALIMAKVYDAGYDDYGNSIRGGGFITTPTTSYCRLARRPISPPFPWLEDRALAYDLLANRIYERMRNLITPKHLASANAFYAFRKKMGNSASNIVAAAGADLTGRKLGMVRAKEKQIREMESMAELCEETKVDISKPFKSAVEVLPSDQFSGIGSAIKERHILTSPNLKSSQPIKPETLAKAGAASAKRTKTPVDRKGPATVKTESKPKSSAKSKAKSSSKADFYSQYYELAKASEKETGVPALVTLAQAALESGWGKHAPGNNFFGVKAKASSPPDTRQLLKTTEILKTQDKKFPEVISITERPDGKYKYVVRDWFRKYASAAEGFADHGKFLLKNRRYKAAFEHSDDPYAFAEKVAEAGYATDPKYAEKLLKTMHDLENAGDLNLPRTPSITPVSSKPQKKAVPATKVPTSVVAKGAAGGSGTITDQLKAQISAGKITFDSTKFKKDLLGENTKGAKVTALLQKLVLDLSTRATIRISSVVRSEGHHGTGRAVDIGNEEIAGTLLPTIATAAKVAELNIDELIFDASVAGKSDRNEWNYDQGKKHNYNKKTLNEHKNHIHFAVKAG